MIIIIIEIMVNYRGLQQSYPNFMLNNNKHTKKKQNLFVKLNYASVCLFQRNIEINS